MTLNKNKVPIALLDHEKLCAVMYEKQLTQIELSRQMKINPRTIHVWQHEDSNISISYYYNLCKCLDIPLESLLKIIEP